MRGGLGSGDVTLDIRVVSYASDDAQLLTAEVQAE